MALLGGDELPLHYDTLSIIEYFKNLLLLNI